MSGNYYNWVQEKLKEHKVYRFYYLFKLKVLRGILTRGILSQNEVKSRNLMSDTFADETCQEIRDNRAVYLSGGEKYNLHDLVPLYFTPKTPTLYKRKDEQENLAFAVVESFIASDSGVKFAFSDGNATNRATKFAYDLKKLSLLNWKVIRSEYWNNFEDGKRIRNAEFFIYPRIPYGRIEKFIVYNNNAAEKAKKTAEQCQKKISVEVDASFFF